MNLEQKLTEVIRYEAIKLTQRFHAYHNHLHQEHLRNKKRSINYPTKIKNKTKFDPFYVRAKATSIAKSIAKKINDKSYCPLEPYIQSVKKSDGGVRPVTIYQIPDAAVSKLFYSRLLSKNKLRFSS